MGRELKRVPLKFDWPLQKRWVGFINPWYEKSHYEQCPRCKGSGTTTAMQRLEDLGRLLMLSGDDARRRHDATPHPYFDEAPLHQTRGIVVSDDILELTQGLAGRPAVGLGHDCIDNWHAIKAIISAAGLNPKKWGRCPECHGTGDKWASPEDKLRAARWCSKEPPRGAGYQIWETVTEGSPITPVFKTPEELADWIIANPWNSLDREISRDQWLAWIKGPGWAPSAMGVVCEGLKSGVKAMVEAQP